MAVSSAITWFFQHVEEGIILEDDDVLPSTEFYPYCSELLQRYHSDPRIMMISADNFQMGANGAHRLITSPAFSAYMGMGNMAARMALLFI